MSFDGNTDKLQPLTPDGSNTDGMNQNPENTNTYIDLKTGLPGLVSNKSIVSSNEKPGIRLGYGHELHIFTFLMPAIQQLNPLFEIYTWIGL